MKWKNKKKPSDSPVIFLIEDFRILLCNESGTKDVWNFGQECAVFHPRTNCSLLIIFHDIFDGHSINNGHNYRLLLYSLYCSVFIACEWRIFASYFLCCRYCPAIAVIHRGQLLLLWSTHQTKGEFKNAVHSARHYYLISSVNRTDIDEIHNYPPQMNIINK